jgi:hypothetical protein
MLYFLVAFAALLYRLDVLLRSERVRLLVQRGQFRAYELRDELRRHALNGEIDVKSEAFDIADELVTSSITGMVFMTPWLLLPYILTGKRPAGTSATRIRDRIIDDGAPAIICDVMRRNVALVGSVARHRNPLVNAGIARLERMLNSPEEDGFYPQIARTVAPAERNTPSNWGSGGRKTPSSWDIRLPSRREARV